MTIMNAINVKSRKKKKITKNSYKTNNNFLISDKDSGGL